jgi:hypothetical protein
MKAPNLGNTTSPQEMEPSTYFPHLFFSFERCGRKNPQVKTGKRFSLRIPQFLRGDYLALCQEAEQSRQSPVAAVEKSPRA